MASRLVVLRFEGEHTAEGMLENVRDMQERGLLELEDAVVASRGQSTEVEIKQTDARRGRFALVGGGAGLVAGLLLGVPIGAVAVGSILGALRDRGVDDDFVKRIGDGLGLDSSAILLLVKQADTERVLEELRPFKGEVVHTTLPAEVERSLRESLAREELPPTS